MLRCFCRLLYLLVSADDLLQLIIYRLIQSKYVCYFIDYAAVKSLSRHFISVPCIMSLRYVNISPLKVRFKAILYICRLMNIWQNLKHLIYFIELLDELVTL